MEQTLLFCKLDKDAKGPVRVTDGSAGYDLFSLEGGFIDKYSQSVVRTGISIKLLKNTCGKIYSRSGLSVREKIEVGAGLIDSDYRGEIKVVLYNYSDKPFYFNKHSRIAQMVIHPILTPNIYEVDRLSLTDNGNSRGENGFGSSGLY